MAPYLLVLFLLVGDYLVQTVQPRVIGMFATVEDCGKAAPAEFAKIDEATGGKLEAITGACVASDIQINAI